MLTPYSFCKPVKSYTSFLDVRNRLPVNAGMSILTLSR